MSNLKLSTRRWKLILSSSLFLVLTFAALMFGLCGHRSYAFAWLALGLAAGAVTLVNMSICLRTAEQVKQPTEAPNGVQAPRDFRCIDPSGSMYSSFGAPRTCRTQKRSRN